MGGGIKRRPKNTASSDALDLLSLRVDAKIAEAFRDEATRLKIYQNQLFEKLWTVYAEKNHASG